MNARDLEKLPREQLVSLARENEVHADEDTSSSDIRNALLLRFPHGYVPYPAGKKRRLSAAKLLDGAKEQVRKTKKKLLKTVRRASFLGRSPPAPPPAVEAPAVEAPASERSATPESAWSTAAVPAHESAAPSILDYGEPDYDEPAQEAPPPLSPLVLNPETFALHLMTPAGEGPLRNATIQPEFVHDYHDRNDLTPASAQDVADLLADMAAMSAQNRTQIARAAAVKAEADRMNKVVDGMRHQVIIERTRRERAEAYWKYWRETAKEWSDAEIWSGQMTIAPVEVRFPEDVNKKPRTYTLMEMEVDTSDDERLKKQWKKKDARFKKRRREQVAAKAQARNVPVEAVSDVETTTTEEEFYSPFVLDDGREDVPESEQFVHRMMPESRGVMFPPLDGGGTIIHQHGQRRLEDGEMRAGKRPRRGQVTKRIAGLEDGEDIENFEARVAEAAGVYWDGTGDYEGGWV